MLSKKPTSSTLSSNDIGLNVLINRTLTSLLDFSKTPLLNSINMKTLSSVSTSPLSGKQGLHFSSQSQRLKARSTKLSIKPINDVSSCPSSPLTSSTSFKNNKKHKMRSVSADQSPVVPEKTGDSECIDEKEKKLNPKKRRKRGESSSNNDSDSKTPVSTSELSRKKKKELPFSSSSRSQTLETKQEIRNSSNSDLNSKSNLQFHRSSYEQQFKLFKCDVCSKSFSTNATLTVHKSIHSETKLFSCSIENCGMSYSKQAGCKIHLQLEADSFGNDPTICSHCSKKFASNATLNAHLKASNYGDCVIMDCPKCERSFMGKTKLKAHQKASMESPGGCKEANKAWTAIMGKLLEKTDNKGGLKRKSDRTTSVEPEQ